MIRRSLFMEISLAGILFVAVSAWSQSKDSHGAQPVNAMKFETISIRDATWAIGWELGLHARRLCLEGAHLGCAGAGVRG